MFSQLFDYIKKCKELDLDDSTIFSVLKDVGWKEEDINYAFTEFRKISLLPPPPIPNYEAAALTINSAPRPSYSYQYQTKPQIQSQQHVQAQPQVFVQPQIQTRPQYQEQYKPQVEPVAERQHNVVEQTPREEAHHSQPVYTITPNQTVVAQNPVNNESLSSVVVTSRANTPQNNAFKFDQQSTDVNNGPITHTVKIKKKFNPFGGIKNIFKKKEKAVKEQTQPLLVEKKKNTFKQRFEKVKKIFTIILGIAAIGLIVWWVISLNNQSGNFDALADTERLAQIDKIQAGIGTYYKQYKRLPTTLTEIDSKKEFTIDKGTNQSFDYKVVTSTSFQVCTVFYTKGVSYDKGITCFPFEINTNGDVSAKLAFNPANGDNSQSNTSADTSVPFYNCKNPVKLLQSNIRCSDENGNCRKPTIVQEFGLSSIGLSNNKDKVAQSFVLPKSGNATELTEISPYVISYFGNMGCMSIYENDVSTQPQSGKLLAEYEISIPTLVKESYNRFFINPIKMDATKSYSVVFSLMDNDSFISFAKGNELSSYYEGSAYYLKRPIEDCTGTGCPTIQWIDRQDDIKFKLKFF